MLICLETVALVTARSRGANKFKNWRGDSWQARTCKILLAKVAAADFGVGANVRLHGQRFQAAC